MAFVDFSGDTLPLNLIYSEVYSNVSGQVLEIDKDIPGAPPVPPGHLWSRLFYTRVLIGDDYTNRGYITQKLIDLGYIAKAIYAPVIPQGYMFLQSFESDTWFKIEAVEVDVDENNSDTRSDVSYQSTDVVSPPEGTIINFNIEIPSSNWFLLGLDDVFCVGLQLDTVSHPGDISFLYAKRNIQQFPELPIPISIPNVCNLIFTDQNNNQYVMRIDDTGSLFFTPYFSMTPYRLFNDPNSLFWNVSEPVLNQLPSQQEVIVNLELPDVRQASFSGKYFSGPSGSGHSGDISFQWRLADIADCPGGTFLTHGTSEDKLWSTSGQLTVLGILEEPSWGP